ncbi:putative WD repeat-containing protein [Actinoplanes sp. SE50]|uniref:WD40 repeat domain-containing protein n=1 Tax=unclassified Actinoplanes TaxID=2626549 RepID=UPI00023EDDEF|nr:MULTISPECIES: hypothetical protein [unclassified Actinoplanes]AEV89240.1 putative WD repeat-containing protein [Actinoplanes sp. SE50/110]ATO87646.1 putative WD repeat-containing protein [Actinoplanes sp. SE50]SLM05065.1 hypothetical protein ACSP50_8381 [Actinoplanes sp. SE50/110]
MRNLDRDLRVTVADLAAGAPPLNDLAMVARIRGRRIRRRRQTALGAAVLVLAGLAITPFAVFRRHAEPAPPAVVPSVTPSSTPPPVAAIRTDWWKAPITLPGGVVITSVSRRGSFNSLDSIPASAGRTVHEGNVALDRATGRYRVYPIDYQEFVAAPTGRYVRVDGTVGGVGILNVQTGGVRQLHHGTGSGAMQWSADGQRMLLSLNAGGIRTIDAKTGQETDVTIPDTGCPDYCFYTWLPGEKEVAIGQVDPAVPQSEDRPDTVGSVKVYSASTGQLSRTLPVHGVPAGSAAWSADGRYVVVLPDASQPDGLRVIETATGRVVGTIPGFRFDYPAVSDQIRFIGNDRILTAEGLDLNYYDLTGKKLAGMRLPDDFADRDVAFGVE